MNIVILFSGSGSLFKDAGFSYPKNLVDVGGKPLVQCVLDNLSQLASESTKFICLVRREENRTYHTGTVIELSLDSAQIIELASETTGAACSALLAVRHINNESPLIIVNGDQIIEKVNLVEVVDNFKKRQLDGGIIVFEDLHPRWSFVKCDESGYVIETAEKRPISKLATAGFYYFSKGRDFVEGAMEMLKKDAQVNEQYYICPVYNELILKQKKIGVYQVDKKLIHPLSTPADVQNYSAKH